jgi:hypothetical protein
MTEYGILKLKKSLGTTKPLFTFHQCKKCKSKVKIAGHHITYVPEKVEPLCSRCHAKITALNTAATIVTGINQDNDLEQCNIVRRKVWRWFLRKKRFITLTDIAVFLGIDYDFTDEQIEYIVCAGERCL